METTDPSTETADRVRLSYRAANRDPDAASDGGTSDSDRVGSGRRDGSEPSDHDVSGSSDRGGSGFAENHLVHDRIRDRQFRAYLRRVHGGEVSGRDEWTEFVNCGCGTTTDVVVRVEAVEGGTVLGDDTDVDLRAIDEFDEQDGRRK